MMPVVPPNPAALAEEDLLIAAWNAGFGAPPVPARGGTQAGEDREDRAAGFSEKISGYGDRTPAVSSDAGGRTSGFGNQMADASNKQKNSPFGVRNPDVRSSSPYPLRPRFGQRAAAKPPPRKRGGQPGNRNRLKHGYRSAAVEGPRRDWMETKRHARALCALAARVIALKTRPSARPEPSTPAYGKAPIQAARPLDEASASGRMPQSDNLSCRRTQQAARESKVTVEAEYGDLGFDPKALKDKYRRERDKRVRDDGNQQYVEMEGQFAHYLDDPYVKRIERAPIADDTDVIVIGGGFGGLLVGARLREAGVKDIRIIEKGGDFGGTWYWNRYPGAACDIESYIYLPLLEETGAMPVEKYTRAPEILAHSRRIGEQFDLYKNACFQTEVKALRWDEEAARWIVETNRGDRMRARFVVMANGPLHRPKLPGIPGVEGFKGHSFHTSRWDYDYTGGTAMGGLDRLKDKVVGIIGTGATAVQCVPHLAASAKRLYVFQRTPSSIDVRNNRPTDPEWAKSLQPGWQKRRMDNFNNIVSGVPESEDMVNDGWTDIITKLGLMARERSTKQMKAADLPSMLQLADFQKMEEIRARADAVVQDKATAEALKPYYNQFCKRPCFHDEYLDAFNRPNVSLIDTEGRGVDRITEDAVIANGREYKIDCLIYATGFEVGTSFTRRSGYELFGRDGATLTDKWKDGVSTLHGITTRGFPNVFMIQPSQSGFTANFPHMIDEQSRHIAHVLTRAMNEQVRTLEPTEDAEAKWVQTILDVAIMRQKFLEECTPGYYNNEGKPSPAAVRNGPYGGGAIAYVKVLEDWRAKGDLEGLEMVRS